VEDALPTTEAPMDGYSASFRRETFDVRDPGLSDSARLALTVDFPPSTLPASKSADRKKYVRRRY
jgi:hypothetical protein